MIGFRLSLESINFRLHYELRYSLFSKDEEDFKRASEKYLSLHSSAFPFKLYFTRHRENLFTRAHISTAKMHFVYRLLLCSSTSLLPSILSSLP